ncbi:MAG: hypothetical protein RLZZ297_680, partial [Chloroflexota bacterium]
MSFVKNHQRFVIFVMILCIFALLAPMWSYPVIAAPSGRANATPVLHGQQGRYVVADGASIGTVVGDVYATDADGDALTYTLVGGDGFAVDPSSGALSVTVVPVRSAGVMRTVVVRASDGTASATAAFSVFVTPAAPFAASGVTRETYNSVNGGSVDEVRASAKYKAGTPDATTVVNQLLLTPQNVAENYGQRYRGYLIPSVSGAYRFWVASDDSSEFRIGTSPDPSTLPTRPQASVSGCAGAYAWYDNATTQVTDSMVLVKGQPYIVELFFKEAGGAEHVAVAWQGPGMSAPVSGNAASVVPQANLKPIDALADDTPPTMPG